MINLNIDTNNIEDSFQRIAHELMNDWMLVCGTGKYRIAELEFYFKDDQHKDKYTHGHDQQKTKGKWYFHPSGIDITFGDSNSFGGILIRALQDLEDDDNYIYGPLNSMTALFSRVNSIYDPSIIFRLEKIDVNITRESPIPCQRIGLNLKRDQIMHNKPYRYIVLPNKKHPGKEKIRKEMLESGQHTTETIKKTWGW